MPQPIADAAHIAPYHTHAASPHGQSTLTSFEGAGRVRQAKSKKNKPSKAEKSSRRPQNENASCTTFPNFQRANDSGHPNPSHPGPLDYIRNSESSRFHGQRHPQEIRFSDVPNYPPPSFQEAMSSPPLSVCPSTTAFGFHSCSGRSVPAPPPVPFGTLSQRHSPASILDNSDTDSDESDLEIVDDQRNSRQSENCTQNRSRALLDDTSALSVPKRRHMSLSPLRTLFPHKPIALQNRALSAQSTSPYSFPKNASFFRSTASLKTVSTGSFFRLPLSAQSSTSLVKAERKGLLKGKDRLVEPLESWEVLGPDSEHYPSLMSAVESLTNPPSPDSGTSSPTQSHTPVHEQFHSSVVEFNSPSPGSIRTTYNLSPSSLEAESRGSQPEALPMPSSRSATLGAGISVATDSSSPHGLFPLSQPSLRHNLSTSPPSPISRRLDASLSLSFHSRGTGSAESNTPNILQLAVETPLPPTPVENESMVPELKASLERAHVTYGRRRFGASNVLTREALHFTEAPLSPSVNNNVEEINLRRSRSHVMPDSRIKPCNSATPTEVPHAINRAPVSPKQKPVPSPLQVSFPSLSTSASSSILISTNASSGRHYPGRPLPKTPQPAMPSQVTEPARYAVDSLYAPHPDTLLKSECRLPVSPEGLLIDFDESTPVHVHSALSSKTNSPTSTVRPSAYNTQVQSISNSSGTIGNTTLGSASETESNLVDIDTPSAENMADISATKNINSVDLALLMPGLGENKERDGSNFDTLRLLSEIMGPVHRGDHAKQLVNEESTDPLLLGHVSIDNRCITKSGKVRTKLYLLDAAVDNCGICSSQFKENDLGALSSCRHAFHERCLKPWLARSKTCPLCRTPLGKFSG